MGEIFDSMVAEMSGADRDPGFLQTALAPLTATSRLGNLAFNNLIMPGLNAVGLSREGSMASDFDFSPESQLNVDPSLRGIAGLLGVDRGQRSGFQTLQGKPLDLGQETLTGYETVLRHQGPEETERFASTGLGKAGLIAGEIGTDPLTVLDFATAPGALAGRSLLGQSKRLARAGMGAEDIAQVARTGLESLTDRTTRDAASTLFNRGRVFNRNPMVQLTGRGLNAGESAVDLARLGDPGDIPLPTKSFSFDDMPIATSDDQLRQLLAPEPQRFGRGLAEAPQDVGTIDPTLEALTGAGQRQLGAPTAPASKALPDPVKNLLTPADKPIRVEAAVEYATDARPLTAGQSIPDTAGKSYDEIQSLMDDRIDEILEQGGRFEDHFDDPIVNALMKKRDAIGKAELHQSADALVDNLSKIDIEDALSRKVLDEAYGIRPDDELGAYTASQYTEKLARDREGRLQRILRVVAENHMESLGKPHLDLGEYLDKGPLTQAGKNSLKKELADKAKRIESMIHDSLVQPTTKALPTPAAKALGVTPPAAPGQTFRDLLTTDEGIIDQTLDAARRSASKYIKDPDALEDATQQIYTNLLTSKTADDVVIAGKDPMNKIRASISGYARNELRGLVSRAKKAPLSLDFQASEEVGGTLTDILPDLRTATPLDLADAREQLELAGRGDEAAYLYSTSRRTGTPVEVLQSVLGSPHIKNVDTVGGNTHLTMNNGAKAVVRTIDDIPAPLGLRPGEEVLGRYIMDSKGVGQVDLSLMATKDTFDHEMVHFAKGLGLFSDNEWVSLVSRFGDDEEKIASGLANALSENRSMFDRIKEFFVKMYEGVTGRSTESGTIAKWREGDVFAREADTGVTLNKFQYETKNIYDKVLDSEHVQSIAEPVGKVDKLLKFAQTLKSPKGRKEAFITGIVEPLFDTQTRIRSLMKETAKGAEVLGSRAAAHVLLQNLPGLLGHAKHVITKGLKHPFTGKALYKGKTGNMVTDIAQPIADFLKKSKGKFSDADMERVMKLADNYAVSRRAIGEFDEMAVAAQTFLDDPASAAKFVTRGILDAGQVDELKAAAEAGEDVTAMLMQKVNKWGETMTGAGADHGMTDMEFHRQFMTHTASAPEREALEKTFAVTQEINRAKLDYVHAKGLIDDEAYELAAAKGDYYTPFQRVMDDEVQRSSGAGGKLWHTFEGSERQIKNPVTETISSMVNWKRRADVNEVMQRWVSEVDPDMLADMGIKRVSQGEADSVPVFVNGEKTYWQFADKNLLGSIENIGRAEPAGSIMKVLSAPSNLIKATVTKTPGFALRNFIKDSVHRAIVSDTGTGILAGFKPIDADEVSRFIEAGGDQAGWYDDVNEGWNKMVTRQMRDLATDKKNIMMDPKRMGDFLSGNWEKWGELISKSETQNRMAEFTGAMDELRKAHPNMPAAEIERVAASRSRDLMDFAVAGSWGRQLNRVIPFLNPALQGTAKLIRTGMKDKWQFAKRMATYVIAPSVGTMMYNDSVGAGDEYRQLPAWRRDNFWNFKVGDHWMTVPKPFEQGALGTGVERIIDRVTGNKRALEGYLPSLAKSLSPTDEAMLLGPMKPFIELMTNKDLFRDKNIVPDYEKDLHISLRKGAKRASNLGKWLASMLNVDPRQTDFVINSFTSDYGRVAQGLSDIGREDKTPFRTTTKSLGFLRDPGAFGSRDPEAVMDIFARTGQSRTAEARSFYDQLRATSAAKTSQERNLAVQRALSTATRTRERLEPRVEQLLLKANRKANR